MPARERLVGGGSSGGGAGGSSGPSALPNLSGGTGQPYTNQQGEWVSPGLESTLASYQNAYKSALNYNMNQYGQGMEGYMQLAQELPQQLAGIGEQQKLFSNARYAQQKKDMLRKAAGYDVTNQSVTGSLAGGIDAQAEYNRKNIDSTINEQQIGLHSTLTQNALGLLERYKRPAPDFSTMAGLTSDVNENAMRYVQGRRNIPQSKILISSPKYYNGFSAPGPYNSFGQFRAAQYAASGNPYNPAELFDPGLVV